MRMDPGNGYTEFWNTTGARGTSAGQGTKRVSIEADGDLVAHTGGVSSTGQITALASGTTAAVHASASSAYVLVGPNSGGASGVFGAHREGVSSSSLDYTTYIGYDCYYDDGNNKWYANRTNLGRKWKTNFGGYHQNRFTISTYDGGGTSGSSLAAGWLEADWTERFGVDANGVVDIGSSLRIGTQTVIDSSRNITAGNISSGAITSSGTMSLTGDFVIDTNTGSRPLRINRIGTSLTYNESLTIHVDDGGARFTSEQDESGRFGGYYFDTKHSTTSRTAYQIEPSNGNSLWYNTSNAAKLKWDASNERLGIINVSPAYALDVTGEVNTTVGYRVNSTTVIDSSGNLTNIGTISAGGELSGTTGTFSGRINSNSLRIASGGYTVDVQEGEEYKYYLVGTGVYDGLWKKVCDVAVGTGLYKALAMKVTLESQGGNFGNTTSVETSEFKATYYRSGATQDDQNNATLAGQNTSYHQLRIIKTATGAYELQILMSLHYRDAFVKIEVLSTNGGTVTIASSIANGSTSGTVYSATASTYVKNLFNEVDAFSVVSDSYYVGSQEVITSGRNLTNIGTISASSDIETATRLKFTNSIANGWSAPIIFRESAYLALSDYSGVKLGGYNGTSYGPRFHVGGNGNVNILEGLLMMAGTTVIDASRNITAGNISSGAITSSGDITSSATLVGAHASAQGFYTFDSSGHLRLLHPGGAAYKSTGSTATGAIKIVLPVSWTSTMMRITIKVYEYAMGESFTIDCGGYNYIGSSSWINTFAYITGQGGTDRNFTVRFGHDGTKCCIYIGELNSTWSYPQLSVTDFQAGFNNTAGTTWRSGWDITFESSAFGTVTKTHTETDNQRYHRDITINGGNLSLRNNTNGDGSIIRDIEFLTTATSGSSDDRSVIIRALNQNGAATNRGGKLELLTRNTAGNFNTTTIDTTGALAVPGALSAGSLATLSSGLQTNTSQLRVKISPWVGTTYGIGMKSGMTFGGLNNYAMTFQMDATADRGWWWGTSSHTDAQGAMALTNAGKLSVASNTRIGMGYTDTVAPSGAMLEVGGGVTVHAGTVWSDTTQGTTGGSIHLDPALNTTHAGGAITWGASDTSTGTTAQAGIYVRSDSSYGTRMYLSTTDSYASGSKTALYINTNGDISVTRGSLVATGNVTAYSDIKLKRDILEIPDALAIVQKIRGVTYERKDKDDGLRHCGVIAQEVEAAGLPEVVRYDEENDVKTVDYGNMVALCIEAIKEQQTQIETLKDIIKEMKNGNNQH